MTMDAVSQVLAGRQTVDGVAPMVGVSVAAHAVAGGRHVPGARRLDGHARGQRGAGDDGQPGRVARPADRRPAARKRAAHPGGGAADARGLSRSCPRPSATPEMIVPTKAPPKKTPPPPVKQAPREAHGAGPPRPGAPRCRRVTRMPIPPRAARAVRRHGHRRRRHGPAPRRRQLLLPAVPDRHAGSHPAQLGQPPAVARRRPAWSSWCSVTAR